jgi:hypothetical protein
MHAKGFDVSLSTVHECIRRMRIAVETGTYPDDLLAQSGESAERHLAELSVCGGIRSASIQGRAVLKINGRSLEGRAYLDEADGRGSFDPGVGGLADKDPISVDLRFPETGRKFIGEAILCFAARDHFHLFDVFED